jgi:hypothetical protein
VTIPRSTAVPWPFTRSAPENEGATPRARSRANNASIQTVPMSQTLATTVNTPRRTFPVAGRRALATCALLAGSLAASCGGGSSAASGGSSGIGGGTGQTFVVAEVTNGFGALLPHTTFRVDPITDQPSTQIMTLRSVDEIYENVRLDNPVLPSPTWDKNARLPSGLPGNHYVAVRMNKPISAASIFDLTPAGAANSFLAGTLQVVGVNGTTGVRTPVQGRGFVVGDDGTGQMVAMTPSRTVQTSGLHELENWVGLVGGVPTALVPDGQGYPGTGTSFAGANTLLTDGVFVFVADNDGDLNDFDTFPAGLQIRIDIGTGVRARDNDFLNTPAVASSTVGPDTILPRVASQQIGLDLLPNITPGNGLEQVDPSTTVSVEFTEPVQPAELGSYDVVENFFEFGSAVSMTFGPQDFLTSVQYKVRPVSAYDLTRYEIIPAYPFPGTGPASNSCDEFSRVDLVVGGETVKDTAGNASNREDSTFFVAGEGRVITNAPVMPDVIYVGRSSPVAVSIIDIGGFGAGTGSPTFDAGNPWKTGNTRFPLNPNVANGSQLVPPLAPGTCTLNGGSEGALTLTRNSALSAVLAGSPVIESIADMAVGFSLDVVFNNSPPPFGCQAGNPNACATLGLKNPAAVIQAPTTRPPQPGETSTVPTGAPNPISWAPHPNPPPITFPPLCISPFLGAREPTSIENTLIITTPSPNNVVPNNLAANGNPLGNPGALIPPSGLWTTDQYVYFNGPSLANPSIPCKTYGYRQQIGHFLYVADRLRGEVVVFNSNRMTVVDRIKVTDPTNMAMSPNLDVLAVTNRIADQVTFIDILPTSTSFNTVIKTVDVGNDPVSIAWQPENEDILVCNRADSSMTIIRAFDLEVRKTVSGALNRPIDVVVGPRQVNGLGLSRNTYFAYIANEDGTISIFESGPDGVGGWGPDNLLGNATQTFNSPAKILLDRTFLDGAIWIAHRNPINTQSQLPKGTSEGALSQLRVTSAVTGQIPVTAIVNLISRQLDLEVVLSVGEESLSGVPVDLAFDCMMNVSSAQANPTTGFSAPGVAAPVNGKGWYRVLPGPTFIPASTPTFLFAAVPNSSSVDVFRVQSGLTRVDANVEQPGLQSIPVTGASVLCDYWRQ